ncbi:hypothetical protein JHK84_044933 [Glycine max]|nr:hypothetical protein JHK85_045439 [Glycine max]KAG5108026.1 hypothetical protein JHK84_044933 [Glycine max]
MDAVDALGTPISHSSTAPTALYVVTAPTALSAVTATTALSTTLTFTLLTSSNPKLNHISLLFLTSLPHPSKRIPILSLFIITNNPFLLMLVWKKTGLGGFWLSKNGGRNQGLISLELEHIVLDGEEEEDEPVFVLTDEWREFFAQSEARRKLGSQSILSSFSYT